MINRFEELGLNKNIVKAITEMGFENPTPIQEKTIPSLLKEKKDIIGLAQTGTGKTGAFGLPMIHLLNFNSRHPQALIICPTRELCLQITRDLQNFTKYIDNANIVAIYGGASIENQIREISRGAQIVVATPGRMVDMINRKKVNLSQVDIVVLDEADEMLNMGFKEDLDSILSETPETKNTWLFSATMPSEVSRIAKKYMNNPMEITVGKQNQGAENIEHIYYVVQARDKYLALKRIADYNPDIFGIVFCRTRMETQQVAEHLIKDGYNADALHGDLSQQQRDMVMSRYRNRTLQMLVATDVAARGIDVNDVTHVINYNLPDDIENYTHRSGRTARAGKSGVSIVIINMKEVGKIRQIERQIGQKFTQGRIPNGIEVCEKQLFHLVQQIHDVPVNEKEIAPYLPKVNDLLMELSKEEIIKRMVSAEFNRFLEYYKKAPDLNVDSRRSDRVERGDRGESAFSSGSSRGKQRFFVNLGEMDQLSPQTLRDFLSSTSNLDANEIGRVDVKNSFSFFETDTRLKDFILEAFKGTKYNGRNVNIEISDSSGGGGRDGGGRTRTRSRNEYGPSDRGGSGGGFRKRSDSGSGSGRGGWSSNGGDRDKGRSGSGSGGQRKRKY